MLGELQSGLLEFCEYVDELGANAVDIIRAVVTGRGFGVEMRGTKAQTGFNG
jgi:hypothetical protein